MFTLTMHSNHIEWHTRDLRTNAKCSRTSE